MPLAKSEGVGLVVVSMIAKAPSIPDTVPSRPSSGATLAMKESQEILALSLIASSSATEAAAVSIASKPCGCLGSAAAMMRVRAQGFCSQYSNAPWTSLLSR